MVMTIYIMFTAESIANHEYLSFLNNFVSPGINYFVYVRFVFYFPITNLSPNLLTRLLNSSLQNPIRESLGRSS